MQYAHAALAERVLGSGPEVVLIHVVVSVGEDIEIDTVASAP